MNALPRPRPTLPAAPAGARALPVPGAKAAIHDPRWPGIAAALSALRDTGRHAVRIVDADCGAGSLLLHAARHARAIGFTAIEARGIDGSPALIGRARAAANRGTDPAIGIVFTLADMIAALRDEHDLPADIVICHDHAGTGHRPEAAMALARAGRIVIGDRATAS